VENLYQAGLLLIVGMTVTISVLALLAGLIWLLKSVDELINKQRIKTYAERVESHKVDIDVNDEIVAVLAAAAMLALKRPVSIKRVRFLQPSSEPAWSVTGRLNIMASHAISRRKSHS
jgi:Na+-transporting methylmalonyl-CoA/oxaloacetate decarboxylase gamma subunit